MNTFNTPTMYGYWVTREWLHDVIDDEYNQTIVFGNNFLKVYTYVEGTTGIIERTFVYSDYIHRLQFPIGIENISDELKHILTSNLKKEIIMLIDTNNGTLEIKIETKFCAFCYKTDVDFILDKNFTIIKEEKIATEGQILSDPFFNVLTICKTFETISFHTNKTDNSFYVTGYDKDNKKKFLYVQDKMKYMPGEGEIRINSSVFNKLINFIKHKLKIHMIHFIIYKEGLLEISSPLNDNSNIYIFIAPMIITNDHDKGGLEVIKEEEPLENCLSDS